MKNTLLKKTKLSKASFTSRMGDFRKLKSSSTSSSSLASFTNAPDGNGSVNNPDSATVGSNATKKRKLNKITDSDLDDDLMPETVLTPATTAAQLSFSEASNSKKIKLEKEEVIVTESVGVASALESGSKKNAESGEEAATAAVATATAMATTFKTPHHLSNEKRFLIRKINAKLYKNIKKVKTKYQQEERRLRRTFTRFPFQQVLLDYLEFKAPALSEHSSDTLSLELKITCSNLIALFSMLINCRVFSHDQFVTTLISRGENFKNNLNDIKRPLGLLINARNKAQSIQQQQQLATQQQTAKLKSSFLAGQAQQTTAASTSTLNHNHPTTQSYNLSINSNSKRNSIEPYQSPLSVQYQQPPASMPAYYAVQTPHTPRACFVSGQVGNQPNAIGAVVSGSQQDMFYNAPHSVPTPSKSVNQLGQADSNMQQQQQQQTQVSFNLNSSIDASLPKSVGPPPPSYQHQLSSSSTSTSISMLGSFQKTISSSIQQPASVLRQTKSLNFGSGLRVVNPSANKPMSKLATFVLHIPVPLLDVYKHERNQRFVVLYGFGAKK